jgi:hypothetical protein
MSIYSAQHSTNQQPRNPFEGPAAGNRYEGFGGGAVGSVGGVNYGNTPWWMLPAGTQNSSFMPAVQPQAPAPAPAPMPVAPRMPMQGGPQDFFAALAGLLSGGARAGQAGPYARPALKQISPETMALINGQGMLPAPNWMAEMPSAAGARPYTGPMYLPEKLRPTEKDPTPWTSSPGWIDPRGNPTLARGRKFPTGPQGPEPVKPGTSDPLILRPVGWDERTGGVMSPPGSRRPAPPGSPAGRRKGWGVDDFRAWAKAAPGGDFM